MSEPSEAHVDAFLEFAGEFGNSVPRSTAVIFLKNNENDINHAASAFMENSDPARYNQSLLTWDEAAWQTGRYGPETREESETAYGDLDQSSGTLMPLLAPTRPSSRVSYEAAHGDPENQSQARRYDDEMVEALKRSMDPEQQVTGASNSESTSEQVEAGFSTFRRLGQASRKVLMPDETREQLLNVPDLSYIEDVSNSLHKLVVSCQSNSSSVDGSIYDAIDRSLYDSDSNQIQYLDAWLVPAVSAILIYSSRGSKADYLEPTQIPLDLDLVPFLRANADRRKSVHSQRALLSQKLEDSRARLQLLNPYAAYPSPTGSFLDLSKLIDNATKFLENACEASHLSKYHIDNTQSPFKAPFGCSDAIRQLKILAETTSEKANAFSRETEEVYKSLRDISHAFTALGKTNSNSENSSYHLRGLASINSIASATLYARCEPLSSTVPLDQTTEHPAYRWVKVDAHITNGVDAQGIQDTSEDLVMKAVRDSKGQFLLLYVREASMPSSIPCLESQNPQSGCEETVGLKAVSAYMADQDMVSATLSNATKAEVTRLGPELPTEPEARRLSSDDSVTVHENVSSDLDTT